MMPANKRKRLQELTPLAVDSMLNCMEKILQIFLSYDLINQNMVYELEKYPSPIEKARHLHMMMSRRGPKAYEVYYQCLRDGDLNDLADLMEDLIDQSNIPPRPLGSHICMKKPIHVSQDTEMVSAEREDPADKMPDRWPLNDYDETSDTLRLCTKLNDPNFREQIQKIKENLVYDIPRGHALIINNKKFETQSGLLTRDGSDIDASLLSSTLGGIGFTVEVQDDCTAQRIVECITKAAVDDRSEKCFLCVVLSHGRPGCVCGVDGKNVYIRTITDCADRVAKLRNVPKIFIIEACQGKNKDKGKNKDVPDSPFTMFGNRHIEKTPSNQPTSLSVSRQASGDAQTFTDPGAVEGVIVDKEEVEVMRKQLSYLTLTKPDGEAVASCKDIFVATATVEGYVAWRSDMRGSWFIQALVYVLKHWSYNEDINDLFMRVNKLVSMQVHRELEYKQMPNVGGNTLTKKFYFFPGVTSADIPK